MKESSTNENFTKTKMELASLPAEVLLHCFSFFSSPKDLISLSKTNHVLRKIAFDESLWEKSQAMKRYYYHNTKPKLKYIRPKRNDWSSQIDHITDLGSGYIAIASSALGFNYIYILDTMHFRLLGKLDIRPFSSMEHGPCGINAVITLGNNQIAVGLSNGTIQIWTLEIADETRWQDSFKKIMHNFVTGKQISILEVCRNHKLNCKVSAIVKLSNSQLVSGGCWDGVISIWDFNKRKCIKKIKASRYRVKSIHTLSNTKLVILSGLDDTLTFLEKCEISIWDIENEKCITSLSKWSENKYIQDSLKPSLQKLPNGYVAYATGYSISLWDIKHSKSIRLQDKFTRHIKNNIKIYESKLALLINDQLISWSPRDGIIRIWNSKADDKGSYIQREISLKFAKYRPKQGKILYHMSGGVIVLSDGRILCGSQYEGLTILDFPKIPENFLEKQLADTEEEEVNSNCKIV